MLACGRAGAGDRPPGGVRQSARIRGERSPILRPETIAYTDFAPSVAAHPAPLRRRRTNRNLKRRSEGFTPSSAAHRSVRSCPGRVPASQTGWMHRLHHRCSGDATGRTAPSAEDRPTRRAPSVPPPRRALRTRRSDGSKSSVCCYEPRDAQLSLGFEKAPGLALRTPGERHVRADETE